MKQNETVGTGKRKPDTKEIVCTIGKSVVRNKQTEERKGREREREHQTDGNTARIGT